MALEELGRTRSAASLTSRLQSELTQRPSAAVAALCAVQLILWTGVPALVSHSLPLDVIEGYLWGREWVIATYKHPALPSWVLEISRIVTGRIGWPAYLVSQLFICATFAIIYGFGRDIMDARSRVLRVLIDGQEQSLETRHTRLYEAFKDRP